MRDADRRRCTDLGAWRKCLRHPRLARPLLAAEVVPVAPYNPRNADDPKDMAYHRTQRGRSDQAAVLDETHNTGRTLNELTTRSRTVASGTFAPETASTHEQKCLLRFAYDSSSRSPTTNEEMIPVERNTL